MSVSAERFFPTSSEGLNIVAVALSAWFRWAWVLAAALAVAAAAAAVAAKVAAAYCCCRLEYKCWVVVHAPGGCELLLFSVPGGTRLAVELSLVFVSFIAWGSQFLSIQWGIGAYTSPDGADNRSEQQAEETRQRPPYDPK